MGIITTPCTLIWPIDRHPNTGAPLVFSNSILMLTARGPHLEDTGAQVISDMDTKGSVWEFPGSPVVRTVCFHFRGHGFDPWSGN